MHSLVIMQSCMMPFQLSPVIILNSTTSAIPTLLKLECLQTETSRSTLCVAARSLTWHC
jgi:hypothetical protein